MSVTKALLCSLVALALFPVASTAQTAGSISYKIGDKAFSFTNGVMEYYSDDGYISLICERTEETPNPSLPGEKVQVVTGMTIQLPGDEKAFVGTHESNTSDSMPVYFSWHETAPSRDGKGMEVKNHLASLDNGDEKKISMRLKIENFGPPGTIIKGTFSGKLFDEDGTLREITDGVFAVPRKDIKD